MTVPPADLASERGVSLGLARARADTLSATTYALSLDVPADVSEFVTGRVVVGFTLAAPGDVVFDFVDAPANLRGTRVNGLVAVPRVTAEHVVIPADVLRAGANDVEFAFTSNSSALNRQSDLLYSLFVPARARYVFPCFDQPDLRARFSLSLSIPRGWAAVSNSPVATDSDDGDTRRVRFEDTAALPTYLFAVVAGALAVERVVRRGRTFRVWHRERDPATIARNLEPVIDVHVRAIEWLESYTGIPYPFAQFDIVLVPSFQFSGMEHPGAIYYNAERLLLAQSASTQDRRARAALIAHETAHMWFGDLVTIRWFNDVWMKEVFANFLAEKVVADLFPEQDHELRFFLANYPSAYAVDRSSGANAIRQELSNLSEAGQLYGPIVYLKAPIVFRQLELRLGAERFRDGARQFLARHRFGSAGWNDLLACFADASGGGLPEWSSAWIHEAGRPQLTTQIHLDTGGRLERVVCRAADPAGRGRLWPQEIRIALGYPDGVEHVRLSMDSDECGARAEGGAPSYVLTGGGGLAYAHCPLDEDSRSWLLAHVEDIADALTRGVAWVALWDELLEGAISARAFLDTAIRALARETEEQNVERLLSFAARGFWTFLSATDREALAPALETCLMARLDSARTMAERSSWFSALRQVATTTDACTWLQQIWRRERVVQGLALSEADEIALAVDLVVRSVTDWREILDAQLGRTKDADRQARLEFLAPALSDDRHERERAFARLRDQDARAREPWALASLQYLNHPLRQAHARQFIRPGLALLPEIARTGDIFFPARWAEALLSGHSSPVAAAIVSGFLAEREDWPPRLRNVVLIAGDLLCRAGRPPY